MGQVPELPTTSYALLGLLSFGQELTGYELKQWADASLRFYWVAPAMSHVYTEVARLEQHGLVEARERGGDGARATRAYAITPQGRRTLDRWLDEAPVEFPLLKHSVALRLFLGHVAGPERTRRMLLEYVDALRAQRGDLEQVRASLGDDPTFASPAMVADWGLAYYDFEARMAADLAARLGDPADDDDGSTSRRAGRSSVT
jgi:DNA-binding PadR family transcriptional regulator